MTQFADSLTMPLAGSILAVTRAAGTPMGYQTTHEIHRQFGRISLPSNVTSVGICPSNNTGIC